MSLGIGHLRQPCSGKLRALFFIFYITVLILTGLFRAVKFGETAWFADGELSACYGTHGMTASSLPPRVRPGRCSCLLAGLHQEAPVPAGRRARRRSCPHFRLARTPQAPSHPRAARGPGRPNPIVVVSRLAWTPGRQALR